MNYHLCGALMLIVVAMGCQPKHKEKQLEQSSVRFDIREMNDEQYPDNPDIGFRSKLYQNQYVSHGALVGHYTIRMI